MEVKIPLGLQICKVMLLMTCADLPAKAMLQNMKQYNGAYGCGVCEDAGVPRPGCPRVRQWPYSTARLRTHKNTLQQAATAIRRNEVVISQHAK